MKRTYTKRSGSFAAILLVLLMVFSLGVPAKAGKAASTIVTAENRINSEVRPKLNHTTLTLKVGEKVRLKLKNAGDARVTFSSGKPKYVSVSKKGYVKGLKACKRAVISVKSRGKTYRCVVKVVKAEESLDDNGNTGGSGDGEGGSKASDEAFGLVGAVGYKKRLDYEASNKQELFTALYDGFERGAETVRVHVPYGTCEMFCNHETNGRRDDYFESLLHVERVLSGYANDFSMSYLDDWSDSYVDFIPEYKAAWRAILAYRYSDYRADNEAKAVLKFMKKLVADSTEGLEDIEDKLGAVYDQIADLGSYRYYDDNSKYAYSKYDITALIYDESAVCEAYASGLQIACELLGLENVMVAGFSQNENHAWNKIKLDGYFYNFDLTWDDNDAGGASRQYFKLTDDDSYFTREHYWSRDWYPASAEWGLV